MLESVRRAAYFSIAATALSVSSVARSQPTPAPVRAPASTPGQGEVASPPAVASPAAPVPAPPGEEAAARTASDLDKAPPPPTNVVYLQYGVAFTAELVSAPGPICDDEGIPCILGSGGGITVRAGWRGAGALYLGGAYELSKQDPSKLYRLALLQQARGEARFYFLNARSIGPYVSGGAGVAGYGDEWSVDTWGPAGFFGAGIEAQITRQTVVGIGAAYRLLYLSAFTDTSGAARSGGIAQLVGLDLVLEQRQPIFTSRDDDAKPR